MPNRGSSTTNQQTLFEVAPAQPELPPTENLAAVLADLAGQRCLICRAGDKIVFASGREQADLMIVGEAPAPDDELTGKPFSGPSGQLLDKMLTAIGYHRDECYVCNVIKCRVTDGPPPAPTAIASCAPYLLRQIASVKPKVILAMGGIAAQAILNVKTPISQLRGRFVDFHDIKVMPTFNPAYLLRLPDKKSEAWADLKQVRDFLKK